MAPEIPRTRCDGPMTEGGGRLGVTGIDVTVGM